ncbi:MAG: carbohydrate ABC transporter permease [Chloroflexota bacterium]
MDGVKSAETRAAYRGLSIRERLRRVGGRLALGFSIIVIVSPAVLVLLWMLSLALKNEVDNTAYPPVFIPTAPTLDNFSQVFSSSPFGLYAVNSVIVSGASTLVALVAGVPAGYGIAKAKAHGLAALVLVSRMTPGLSFLIPLFMLFRVVGLTGSLWSLVITHMVITLPLVVWVMIGFFEDLHPELEEAALTDGCSIWQAFLHVAMPLSRPGIVVAGILAFIFSWNNFIFGAVLAGRETRTLPVAVYNVLTYEQVSWGPLAAAALVVTLPVLVLTVFVQKHIVTGLASGGIKGG